ncbi:RDD family protein [Phycicoccus sp. CSK15P-2]|uniref:RDD family protein n=1 Tax=Phycicoccus sp. CSK15P-2 TaxID=2807627 RepID=UPI00194E1286|nr:RDD family protein [Phycicoccus sp. CSK15P-2]MBM6404093.1 RDD family protein [Phycicoccus sp. CSK15P-2]
MPTDDALHGGAPAPPTATLLRRLVAVVVDWLLAQLVAVAFIGIDTSRGGAAAFAPLGVFFVLTVVLVSLTGSTVGHRLLGLQVWQVRPGSFPLQVLVRTALLCLFVPAVLSGRDGRGLHDVAAGTRIVHPGGAPGPGK